MTWVLWRQYRIMALVAGVLLALTIAGLLLSGFHIMDVARQLGVVACVYQQTDACTQIKITFEERVMYEETAVYLWLFLLPLLVGLFVGAPLIAREWEQGTYRLAWTQSVSRSRWLIHRLSVLGLVILLASIVPALLSFWWNGPQMGISSVWVVYDNKGMVPVAYALFAFALGTASGTLFRKMLPALAVTLLLFLLVRIAIAIWLRPYFLPPVMTATLDAAWSSPVEVRQGMTVQIQYIDRQGHMISTEEAFKLCFGNTGNPDQCLHDLGIRYYILYQPADRFWLFQGIEAALYLVLILGLLGLTTWLVRRRLC
jgi:hypothetical protein